MFVAMALFTDLKSMFIVFPVEEIDNYTSGLQQDGQWHTALPAPIAEVWNGAANVLLELGSAFNIKVD